MKDIFERYEELTGDIYEFGQLDTEEKNKEYSKLENEIKQAIRLQELVKKEWVRVQELAKKPMDSFTFGQYKIIRYLIETSQGIKPDYIDTKSLLEKSKIIDKS